MSDEPKSLSIILTLFDDDSVREKLTVMTKLEAMTDDSRNPDDGFYEKLEDEFLQIGKTYRLTFEEVE